MTRALLVALVALAAAGRAAATELRIDPYVQDVRPDGFTVVFETDVRADAELVVGEQRIATHGTRHEVRVDRLQPATRYRYEVWLDGAARVIADTNTVPDDARPLTFVVYGDTRDGGEMERRVARAILDESPDLALHTGDLVRVADEDELWRAFFDAESPLLRRVPVYPTAGNHELYRDPAGDHFRQYFVLPDEGRARRYYSFRFGPVRFIALDGNKVTDTQTAWLERTLQAAREEHARHVFVFLHQPPFSTGGHCGAALTEAAWVDLFERYQVRAVFGGHDHAYQRLERGGVRYFITGGGGAQVYPERPDCYSFDQAAQRIYRAAYHYVRVRVIGDDVDVTAVPISDGAAAAPIDAVRWRAGDVLVAHDEPPLIDDRLLSAWPGGGGRVRWTLAASGLLLLALAGRLLRRRGKTR
jgi:hypothetical protein